MDCRDLKFSPNLSKERVERAEQVLGEKTLKKLICFVLYLLGVDRASCETGRC